jgi:hypothetical protein
MSWLPKSDAINSTKTIWEIVFIYKKAEISHILRQTPWNIHEQQNVLQEEVLYSQGRANRRWSRDSPGITWDPISRITKSALLLAYCASFTFPSLHWQPGSSKLNIWPTISNTTGIFYAQPYSQLHLTCPQIPLILIYYFWIDFIFFRRFRFTARKNRRYRAPKYTLPLLRLSLPYCQHPPPQDASRSIIIIQSV